MPTRPGRRCTRNGCGRSAAGPGATTPVQVDYPADACPRTMDLLRRAVHVDVSPDLTAGQAEQIGAAVAATVERLA